MGLTAQQVRDQAFRTVRQVTGYDIDEVDGFLERVEAELARREREGSGPDAPRSAAGILELAQRTADDALEQAREQADRIVGQARARAVEEVAALRAEREELQAQVESLGSEVESLAARVESLRALEAGVRHDLATYLESRLLDLRGRSAAEGASAARQGSPAVLVSGALPGPAAGSR